MIGYLRRILLLTTLIALPMVASAQRVGFGTNVVEWANLGTINGEFSVAVDQHWSLNANALYNPWTFNKGDQEKQFENRQRTFAVGTRAWLWHVYSGWWFGAKAQYQEYNRGGILNRQSEEGDAYGGGLSFGYTLLMSKHVNFEFGAGLWGGKTYYTTYACPTCGRVVDSGGKWFVLPNDIMFSIVFVL